MEKFYFEVPSISRKNDAIEYINELNNYEEWLNKLQEDYTRIPNEEKVPTRTYFLVRSNDNKIVGMINIRLELNEKLRKYGGHVGYSIRPTERGKGYNKINLYLGLKVCKEHGIEKVLMDADKENPASWRTMEALGGINIKEFFDDEIEHCIVKDYEIDVTQSISNNSDTYEPMIEHITLRKYNNNDYTFVYELKRTAYKKYVEECYGAWIEEEQQKYFENFMSRVEEKAYIIQYDSKDIGFYNGEILNNGNYEIENICIIPEYQRKGIGTKILKDIIEKYNETNIEIQYFKQNPVGNLYERLGFEKYGENNFHYKMIKH